jgi:diguanylate cyclase (GGDEF)-like protein
MQTIPKIDRQKILIIDDTAANIQVLSEFLSEEYTVYFATSGEKGLELANGKMPDLILLDIMMPEMDGYQVCLRLKGAEATRHIPVIFITAMASIEEEAMGLEIGAIDYITKPISPPVVKIRVRNHLELKRHSDMLELLSAELALKNRQLDILARQDGLTGLANRRCFDEALDAEIRRAVRSRKPLSLILCDIDYFKPYNDHYGHLAGDDCLRSIGALLRTLFQRAGDLPSRYGGEEFAVILPDTTADEALHLSDTLCSEVHKLSLPHAFSDVAGVVTISVGVVSSIVSSGQTAEWFADQADKALYRSKDAGRNRVTVALPEVTKNS